MRDEIEYIMYIIEYIMYNVHVVQKSLPVMVQRDGLQKRLSVTPNIWSGRGLLGSVFTE